MARDWKTWGGIAGDSDLALRLDDDVDDWRGGRERRATEPVEHLVAHMTGRTFIAAAIKRGDDPLEALLSYYTSKRTSSHYLGGWAGELYQMTDDRIRVDHVGVYATERRLYLRGGWARGKPDHEGRVIAAATVRRWREAWPEYKSPQHLFAGKAINDRSCGIEMPPCWVGGKYIAEPLRPGLWHTAAQHCLYAMLACDLADRHGWRPNWWIDPKGGPRSPTLPGHCDVDLYGRSQKSGGWDPGALRKSPRWDWPTVQSLIGWRLVSTSLRVFLRQVGDAFGRAAVALF